MSNSSQHTEDLLRSLQIRPEMTALLVVDMQNGFCHLNGTLSKAGIDIEPLSRVTKNVKKLVRLCRESKIPVIWIVVETFKEDASLRKHIIPTHFEKRGQGIAGICLKGTWDAEIIDELKPEIRKEDHITVKHRFSAFYSTDLDAVLCSLDARLLVVCGVSTNVCVDSTVRDAYMRDYDVLLIDDCVASSDDELHRATIRNVDTFFGAVMSLKEFSSLLKVESFH